MQRKKWVCRQGADGSFQMIPIEDDFRLDGSKSHAVIQDSMAPTWHPADGRTYESKSAFRAVSRAHGLTEVGNDYKTKDGSIKPLMSPERPRETVRESIQKTLQGYRAKYHD